MKKIAVLAMALLLAAVTTYAGTEAGSTELGGAITVIKPQQGDLSGYAQGTIGYFVTSMLQVRAMASLNISGSVSGTAGGGLDLYFTPEMETVPFIGAAAQTSIGSNSGFADGLLLDIHAGMKQFVRENASINLSVSYLTSTKDFGSGSIIGLFGVSVYL